MHAVSLDKTIYDRILKEVPTFKFISQSILIERLKINGSLARVAIRHLEKEKLIKRIVHHSAQLIYSAFFHLLSFLVVEFPPSSAHNIIRLNVVSHLFPLIMLARLYVINGILT